VVPLICIHVPRIYVFRETAKTWMAGTSPAMTVCDFNGPGRALAGQKLNQFRRQCARFDPTMLRIERRANPRFHAFGGHDAGVQDLMLQVEGAAAQIRDAGLDDDLVTPSRRRQEPGFVFDDGKTVDAEFGDQALQRKAALRKQSVDAHIEPDEIIRVVNDPGRIAMTELYRDGALGPEHRTA